MEPSTFFEKFELFADAPDAVAKLRELVLEVAATGRLLPKKIEWETRPLKSLATKIGSGATPSGGRASYFSSGIPLIRSMNVHFRGFDRSGLVFLNEEQANELSNVTVAANDVLLNITGASIGRVTIAPYDMAGARVNQHVTIIRPTPDLYPRFLWLFLASPSTQRMIDEIQVGATRQAVTKGMIEQFEIPLPPLAEQKRIVAKVDELMALCDRLEAQQQERETRHAALARASLARFTATPTVSNLQFLFQESFPIAPADLRKTILTLAVQGKLVQQDPDEEPAKTNAGAALKVTELPWPVPRSWKWFRLGNVANIKHGYAFSSDSFTSNSTPYVVTTPGNFYEAGGFRDRGANTKYFEGDVPPAFIFKAGDLIIPMTEQAAGLLGSPAFIPDDGKTYLHNQRLGKLEFFSDEILPAFAFWFFNTGFFRGELAETCTGMKVRHTSPKRVLVVPIPLPPLAEQRRIVAKVEQLMALADTLEQQLDASRATAEKLLTALVAELTRAKAPAETEKAPLLAAEAPAPYGQPAEIVPFQPSVAQARLLLAAEIADQLHGGQYFHRIKFMKLLYACEHVGRLEEVQGNWRRAAAGPYDDELINGVERSLAQSGWFKIVEDHSTGQVRYELLKKPEHLREYEGLWSREQRTAIQRVIDLARHWQRKPAEMFATTYAAWNDLLIRGETVTDDAILTQILERWHEDKKRIPCHEWLQEIQRIRDRKMAPTGFGRATASPRHLALALQ